MTFLPQAIQTPLAEDGEEVELSDECKEMEAIYSQLIAESIVVDLLSKLSDREKIFFLYQLMSLFGYSISQERFAKTLDISRINYINKLNALKIKLRIFLSSNKDGVSTL